MMHGYIMRYAMLRYVINHEMINIVRTPQDTPTYISIPRLNDVIVVCGETLEVEMGVCYFLFLFMYRVLN